MSNCKNSSDWSGTLEQGVNKNKKKSLWHGVEIAMKVKVVDHKLRKADEADMHAN